MRITERRDTSLAIARAAGDLALDYFRKQDSLRIDRKGHQDYVSQADRQVELLVRRKLADAFPDDAIVGEEHAPTPGSSGFSWVIDPIDGTANFISGIPAWVVVIAGVADGQTQVGVIHDPCHGETWVAQRGGGATLNGAPLQLSAGRGLKDGTVGIGYSNRVGYDGVLRLMQAIFDEGGIFLRNATGALSLAYVASGRLLGYSEEHMNAWDCLAGQLIVAEAGGRVEVQDADSMIADGGRVIVGLPGVFDDLLRISERAFGG
ncbi:MAG: inositol monophosphatase [Rhodobacter sp.]|jgi:myo-inositol-1(or 4)-monophosphatase|nr:inositol monophosphatase [Rhodobacter sp.]